MRRIPFALLLFPLALWSAGVLAAAQQPPAAVQEVVAAERAFASRAQMVNARDAFAENFAPDGRFFGPNPGPAFPGLREGEPWGVNIQWRPVAAGISRSADFGWTTGPAEYRRALGDVPHRWGYYTSVWIKQPDGRWQVAIDGGVTVPQPTLVVADWRDEPRHERRGRDWRPSYFGPTPEQRIQGLLAADRRLAERASENAANAFEAVLLRDARAHRDGQPPAVGKNAVLGLLRDGAATYRWTPAGARVAPSGELGYSHGSGEKQTTTGPQPFHYLAIWEKHDGRWQLRVLVHTLAPQPTAG